MKKKLEIVIVIFVLILLIVIVFNILPKKDSADKVKIYLESIGFKNDEGSTLYTKKVSVLDLDDYNKKVQNNKKANYEMLYFDINKKEFYKDVMSYNEGINTSFTPTYNFLDDSLKYIYRINLEETNVIVEGTYDGKDFTCEPTFYFQFSYDDAKNDICTKVRYDVIDFHYEAKTLINKSEILDIIKNKTGETE